MKPKRVLVTGVQGLVGHTVYRHLRMQSHRYDVYGLDALDTISTRLKESFGIPKNAPPGTLPSDVQLKSVYEELHNSTPTRFYHVKLTGPMDPIKEALKGVDVVLHFAGNAEPDQELDDTMANVKGTCQLFQCCKELKIPRLIFGSSVRVMKGYHDEKPYKAFFHKGLKPAIKKRARLTEKSTPKPQDRYSVSKLWLEELARKHAIAGDFSCLCLRIGWVNGSDEPHQREMIWVSQRDICQIVERSISAPMTDKFQFGIYFAISRSEFDWISTRKAKRHLGYLPMDHFGPFMIDK